MSFSGLKTAVKRETEKLIDNQGGLYHGDVEDICASFQKTTSEIFKYKTMNAIKFFNNNFKGDKNLAIVGGVAANKSLRKSLKCFKVCSKQNS